MITGLIFDIKKFAIHDGPGLRTTVFFKGCPLNCLLCHNPESQSFEPEIWLRDERCIQCDDCLEVCEQGAISLKEGWPYIDREKCNLSGICVDTCPVAAIEIIGTRMTVDHVISEIQKDSIFYDESGGGVTFSGGEPLSQPDFLLELLRACRRQEIRTTLDTCGFAPPEVFQKISSLVDLTLYDLKVLDNERHREFTGVSNELIVENIRWLSEQGHPAIVRFPPVPGITDDEENVRSLGEFISSLSTIDRIDILPYHMIGVGKYARLDRDYKLSETKVPTSPKIAEIAGILKEYELDVTVRGESYVPE